MRAIQATELKAKLSSVLGDVERGETIVIRRHGKIIGKIVPVDDGQQRRAETVQRILDYKKKAKSTGITVEEILSARDEGRKPF